MLLNFVAVNLPSKYLNEAVEQFASLPSIGKRSALRLVLELLKRSPEEIDRFSNAVRAIKENINYCDSCGNISDEKICTICANPARDHRMVCIVEDIRDIMAIEATGRSEEHTSELQSRPHLVCRLLLEKKKKKNNI